MRDKVPAHNAIRKLQVSYFRIRDFLAARVHLVSPTLPSQYPERSIQPAASCPRGQQQQQQQQAAASMALLHQPGHGAPATSSPDRLSQEEKAQGSVDLKAVDTLDGPVAGEVTSWGKTRAWIRRIGAEEFGIERIPEHLRTDQNPRDLFTAFFSANFCVASLALGYFGPASFGLGWWDSFLAVIFFNIVGNLFPAAVATFGPKLGFRTMIVPRYAFGWWPAKLLAALNIINMIGWGIVNALSGAAILYDVGHGDLPMAVCVLLIFLVAILIGLFGYNVLHIYERYAWIAMLVAFAIVAGFGAPHFINIPMKTGFENATHVLSYGTIVFGFGVAWAAMSADYGVYMRETTKPWQAFWYTYGGLTISMILVELLGVAVGTMTVSENPVIIAAYERAGIGGLIGAVFSNHNAGVRGFGKFIQVILSFSVCAVVIFNIYSLGLSAQMVTQKALKIPRLVWSGVGSCIMLVAAVAGRDNLTTVMENFLGMCAYWITPFATILLLENFLFRKGFNYDLTAWNDPHMLPRGIAATVAWLIATALAVITMSQVWWIGPIALAIGGSSGTDISWMLAFVTSAVIFIPLRYWEKKKWGL